LSQKSKITTNKPNENKRTKTKTKTKTNKNGKRLVR
jgi:hypothetical protein